MGINAQTSVPTFSPGDTLTAANVNLLTNGIGVFAGTATRNAAFGSAGEKTLAEGQFAYLEDTNTTQFYDGSAWQSVGAGGLTCVKAETAFSAVGSFTADSVFTSSYTNYLLTFNYTQSNTSGVASIRYRTSGTSNTTANYNFNSNLITTTLNAVQTSGATSSQVLQNVGTGGVIGTTQIYSPQLAAKTYANTFGTTDSGAAQITSTGSFTLTTQFDGIEFLISLGTITGTYTIYGYSKTV